VVIPGRLEFINIKYNILHVARNIVVSQRMASSHRPVPESQSVGMW